MTGLEAVRTVLVTPLAPARTGNGLAMRAGMLLEALAAGGPVDLVVVPVAGAAEPLAWARAHARAVVVADLPEGRGARRHLTAQLADPRLRERLTRTAPLPRAAALAPPTVAAGIAEVLPDDGSPAAVVALRTYLAPVGIELGRRLGAARVVIDADDDDETLLRALGDDAEAEAFGRLAAAWLPDADEVWAAAPAEADALGARHDLRSVRVVPNTVRTTNRLTPPPGNGRLLFVGNLTYAPNVHAARTLALDVLPRVRARRPAATLDLVGPSDAGALDDVALLDGVQVPGYVVDLAPWYTRADVVVAPLEHGAGTRIKILEACGFGRAVIASTAAVAGLDLVPDEEVVVADGADDTAAAVLALLDDVERSRSLADAGRAAVAARYSPAAVGPSVRRGALGEPEGTSTACRLLWHDVVIDVADHGVLDALQTVVPTAVHAFPAAFRVRYGVEGRRGAYRVIEEGDLVATATTAEEARDLVHLRLHRRVFERVSLDGWIRLHGALVDLDGTRVLVTGPSRVGKSTLALRLLLDGAAVQGDESVLLRGRESVAVARPFHLKPGAESVVPELVGLRSRLPHIGDVVVADPGRLGYEWRLTIAPLDHLVVLTPGADVQCAPVRYTEILPELVPQLFPVTETKSTLLRFLTSALVGARCHRLGVGDPETMSRALTGELG